MKKFSLLLLFLFLSGKLLFSQAAGSGAPPQGSDPTIKNYPGIPIITYIKETPEWVHADSVYKKLDSAGIFAAQVVDMKTDYANTIFSGTRFKILPDQIKDSTTNFVNLYSEAYYSKWEAEGVSNTDDGEATLYFNSVIGKLTHDGSAVQTKPGEQGDTTISSDGSARELIYGPYYRQEIKYAHIDSVYILYNADFRLKKEDLYGVHASSDTVCFIQVTTSRLNQNVLIDTVIKGLPIIYSQLADTFKTFSFTYDYYNVDTLFTTDRRHGRAFSDYIQFKVLWKGNPAKMSLYVDNITLSDRRGRRLKEENTALLAKGEIERAIENFVTKTAGWMGLDEPQSIDQFEPVRIVQQILNDKGKSYWFAFGNNWNGKWGETQYGTYKLSQFEEFYKHVKKADFWSSRYLYTPVDLGYTNFGLDWRDGQIRVQVDNIYRHFKDKDNVFWGPCVQTGLYGSTTSWQQLNEIGSKELLYNVNLGLLCGAKVITFWPYFADTIIGKPASTTALVNIIWAHKDSHDVDPVGYVYTDKWHTIKDTIAPRLKGFMGRKLHNLEPKTYLLTMLAYPFTNQSHDFIDYIKADTTYSDTCIVDLGIFKDPVDLSIKYFMPLNRYYSDTAKHNLTFGLKDLNFNNWKLTNYVDSTFFTLTSTNGKAEFTDIIYPGDAGLYSLIPIINCGGNILISDSISGTQILNQDGDPLFIKSNATLSVNGTYNIYKDITIEEGGTLNITSTGSLNFYNGAKLHVYGTLTSGGGFPSTKRIVDFHYTAGGIVLYKAQTLENLSIKNTFSIGINLNSAIDTSQITVIKGCEFINCGTGVYGTGIKNVIVQYNSLSGCSEGASFNYSSKLYIFNNSFSSCGSGIYLTSTIDNEVRHNQISNCGFGIYLGYSTINAGNNRIYNSELNGIYVGTGSLLNMKGILRMMPCIHALIFTRERGYNSIYNNVSTDGIFTPPAEGDGAEIFLYNSILLADSGSNQIYDNRFNTTTYPIRNLIDGYFDGEPEAIRLTHNEWGDTAGIPIQDRFGHLQVIYNPIGVLPEPQNAEGCLKINVVHSSNGPIAIDTNYAEEGSDGPDYISYLENLFNIEQEYRGGGDYASSESTLKTLISMFLDIDECSEAFSLLYSNYEERSASSEEFLALGDYYNSLLLDCTNDPNIESIRHYADLCLMQGGQYQQAMASFQSIIDQYQGTERADFALIDLYTAAYLDSTQQLGKSLIKVTSETLNNKRRELLLKKLGKWEGKSPKQMPTEYTLSQNYPNPFNPSTNIRYAIKDRAEVKLLVYDILGRVVKELVNEVKEPGYYDVKLNMNNFASGVYFYSLQTKHYVKTNKMLLIK